jgi:hypothetical protein
MRLPTEREGERALNIINFELLPVQIVKIQFSEVLRIMFYLKQFSLDVY